MHKDVHNRMVYDSESGTVQLSSDRYWVKHTVV